jgi:hypothetical protein
MRMMITKYIDTCETIANNHNLPSRIVEWAEQLYDQLTSSSSFTMVRVEDLLLLDQVIADHEFGLSRIDHSLARREPQVLPEPEDDGQHNELQENEDFAHDNDYSPYD